MKKRICNLGIIISLLITVLGYGQEPPSINLLDISFGSPEATELAKYGNLEVSLYKGTPNITVPIANIALRGFNLPVYLSYDNGGIKVDQIATNIGLGWSLMAGGQITVTTHGLSDVRNDFELPSDLENFDPNKWHGGTTTANYDDYEFAYEIFDPLTAGSPKNMKQDVFYFNYPGASGKFIVEGDLTFGSSRVFHTVPYKNHNISYVGNGELGHFEIADGQGNIFIFDKLEETSTEKDRSACAAPPFTGGSGNDSPTPISEEFSRSYTWHLTKITTKNKEDIIFEYDDFQTSFTYVESVIEQKFYAQSGQPVACPNVATTLYSCNSEKTIEPPRLKKIYNTRTEQEIEFNYSTAAREDFGNSTYRRLESISINRHNNLVTSFTLDNDQYFSSGGSGQTTKRLKLDSVTELGKPGYEFTYNSSGLPARGSKSQDHWGFYNGKSNTTLIPAAGANRNVDVAYIDRWSMEEITYPTGGKSVFDMEGISTGGGLRVKTIHDLDGVGNTLAKKTYTYADLSQTGGYEYKDFIEHYLDSDYDSSNPPGDGNEAWASCQYERHTSTNVPPVNYMDTPDYGFGKVTETYSDGTNGKKEYYFSNTISDLTTSTIGEIGSLDWGKGELIEEKVYGSSGNLLTKTTNDFNVYRSNNVLSDWSSSTTTNENYIFGMDIKLKRPEKEIGGGGVLGLGFIMPARFLVNKYRVISSWYHPKTTTKIVYDPQNSNNYSVSTISRTYYSSDRLHQLTETTNGISRKTKITYADNVYTGMVYTKPSEIFSVEILDGSNNQLTKRWQTWKFDSGTQVYESDKIYDWVDRNSNGTAPDSTDNNDSNNPNELKELQEIKDYDNYGNPIEVEFADGSVSKYFYGGDSNPYTNYTSGTSAVNGVLGVYLTGIQRSINGIDSTPCSTDDLCSKVSYNNIGQIASATDENLKVTTFEYDDINRLVKSTNPEGGVTKNHYFYSKESTGSYVSSAPNLVETVTGTDSYEANFSSSSGWTYGGDVVFGVSNAGETTVRMGHNGGGGSSYIYRSPGEQHLWAKVDFYPDNTTQSPAGVHAQPLAFQDPASGAPNRMTIRYNADTDEFFVFHRQNSSAWYTDYPFTIDAVPNQWYTLEMEKKGTVCMVWVYKKGESRSSGEYYEVDGYPADWTPKVQAWSKDDYYYLANLEYVINPQTSISYLDGLGREIQLQVRGANKVITTETLYDERGLPEVTSRPIETTTTVAPGYYNSGLMGSSFTPSSSGQELLPGALVHDYYGGIVHLLNDEDFAYSQTQYEDSPLARVEKSTLPGTSHKMGSNKEIVTTYSLNTTETFDTPAVTGVIGARNWGTNKLTKTISKDPSGNKTITYTNGWGQTIASGVDMDVTGAGVDNLSRSSSDLVTEFAYDTRGNLVLVEDPKGLITTYTYNILGQLETKNLPDQTHPHTYRYDNKGRLRFHRDPVLDAASDHYYYTKYDELDRPTEMGIRTSSADFDDETDINNQSFPTSSYTSYLKYWYDGNSPLSGHTPNNTKGRLTRAQYKDLNSTYLGSTYYSYNSLGLVEWVIQQPAQPTSSNNRKIEYSYDELGRLTRLYFNPLSSSSDDHYFWYYYDELGRLEKVTSYGTNDESSALEEAKYTYYADGQVEKLTLGGGAQVVDYEYTVQGWMERINDGLISGTDRFGLYLDYMDNGNIEQQQWKQAGIGSSTYNYYYDYDKANRLTEACYGSSTCTTMGSFDAKYTYDKNGNLESITREGNTSSADRYFDHIYVTGTNKLQTIYENGQNRSFTHDANGNITVNGVQGITSSSYDWRNLPYSMAANGSTMRYVYDADGNRVKKEFVGNSNIWYVRGADGQTIAAYQGTTLLYINILAGSQIIGQIEN